MQNDEPLTRYLKNPSKELTAPVRWTPPPCSAPPSSLRAQQAHGRVAADPCADHGTHRGAQTPVLKGPAPNLAMLNPVIESGIERGETPYSPNTAAPAPEHGPTAAAAAGTTSTRLERI